MPYSYMCLRQKTGADQSKPPHCSISASLCKFIALIVLIYRTMDLVLLQSTTNNYLTFIIFEILPEITQWLLYKRRKMIPQNWKWKHIAPNYIVYFSKENQFYKNYTFNSCMNKNHHCWREHFKDICILSTLPPYNFLWFSNIPLLNVGQYVF